MFILDIVLPTNNVHADDLVHYAEVVDLVHSADLVLLPEAARNCPNGWVDGTYVGMGR